MILGYDVRHLIAPFKASGAFNMIENATHSALREMTMFNYDQALLTNGRRIKPRPYDTEAPPCESPSGSSIALPATSTFRTVDVTSVQRLITYPPLPRSQPYTVMHVALSEHGHRLVPPNLAAAAVAFNLPPCKALRHFHSFICPVRA